MTSAAAHGVPHSRRDGTGVLQQWLPRRVDNTYRGRKLALWLFGVIVFIKTMQSLMSIFNTRTVAVSADGIPLSTFPPGAAGTVVSIFALLGLTMFLVCIVAILVLFRYRGLVPFMFSLFLLDFLARRTILHFLPIVRTGRTAVFYINLTLLALMVAGLALSLWRRDDLAPDRRPAG